MIMEKMWSCVKDPGRLWLYLLAYTPMIFLPQDIKTKIKFKYWTGRTLDFEHMKRYYEKIAWIKSRYHNPLLHICADKYNVRKYVKKKIGKEYLIPIYGVFSTVKAIDFSKLPEKFVMKATHTSGNILICKNKKKFVTKKNLRIMNGWLKRDYWLHNGEWCYKDVPRRIICEKLLEVGYGIVPKDYKFYCFNGEPVYLELIHDRTVRTSEDVCSNKASPCETVYDMDWNLMEGWTIDSQFDFDKSKAQEQPGCFEEMKEIARKLSKDFPHVRVDLYEVDGKIYFGELTFFSAGGCGKTYPDELDLIMGKLLNLDDYKKMSGGKGENYV